METLVRRQIDVESMARGGYQSLQSAERRLTSTGFVGTHNALSDMSTTGNIGLGQIGSSASFTQE